MGGALVKVWCVWELKVPVGVRGVGAGVGISSLTHIPILVVPRRRLLLLVGLGLVVFFQLTLVCWRAGDVAGLPLCEHLILEVLLLMKLLSGLRLLLLLLSLLKLLLELREFLWLLLLLILLLGLRKFPLLLLLLLLLLWRQCCVQLLFLLLLLLLLLEWC